MCLDKHLALHAKTVEGYIAHLEKLLLDDYGYARCCHCKRVDFSEGMIEVASEDAFVCAACESAYYRAVKMGASEASDEKDYRWAKGQR